MTTQVGTFIPLQAQNTAFGANQLNQNNSWGLNGWNPVAQNNSWGLNGWNPATQQNNSWGLTGWNPATQNNSWGLNGWNPATQNNSWGFSGWNPVAQNNSWGLNGWNPNSALVSGAGWNQNHSYSPNNTAVWVVPTSGTNISEFGQGFGTNGTQVAFIPQTGSFSANSYVPGNTIVQGITAGSPVVGVSGTIHNGQQNLTGAAQSLATELSENNHEYVISFDVPGIEIQDLDISLAGNTILINGIRKGTHDSSSFTYSEIARGNLSRAIAVPFDVSPTKAINTSLENGVLKIRIAKDSQSEKKTTTRKVKIG